MKSRAVPLIQQFNMKTIAIDIDDVLALSASAFVDFSNKRWGTNLGVDDYHEHWAELWQVDNSEVNKRALEYWNSGTTKNVNAIVDGEVVLRLLAQSYKLVIATARRIHTESDTTAWLDKHYNKLFSEIHFAGMWDKITDNSIKATKAELCKRIGADFLIDDQPKHCFAAASAGVKSILFGDYGWNRSIVLPKGVDRCSDWKSVLMYFHEYEQV